MTQAPEARARAHIVSHQLEKTIKNTTNEKVQSSEIDKIFEWGSNKAQPKNNNINMRNAQGLEEKEVLV